MQRRTSRRTIFGALAVLTAMIIGMLAWSPTATAEQRAGQTRGQQTHAGQKHNAQKHNAATKHTAQRNSAHAKAQQTPQRGMLAAAAKSPLDDLLDGLLGDNGVAGKHGPVGTIVNDTVPKAVKKTVDSTTGLVNTALGHGKSTAPAPTPPKPTSSAPGHAPAQPTHPTTRHAAATSTTPATRDSAATIRTAPLDSPALVAVKQPAGQKGSAPAEVEPPRAVALTPASLLSAPGTGILVGVMFAFAAGVFAVVYGAGYRGRRAR